MNNIETINGIGPKISEEFHKAEIYTIEDLLYYYPKRYQIIKRTDMSKVIDQEKVMIDGIVDSKPTIISMNSKLKRIIFRLVTKNAIYNILVFNQTYLSNNLTIGTKIIVAGKYDFKKNTIIASEIRKGFLPNTSTIEPIYQKIGDINRKSISKFISQALKITTTIEDYIPNNIKEKYKFPTKLWSINQIHKPQNTISYRKALQRLKYEEFYNYLYKIKQLKEKRLKEEECIQRTYPKEKLDKFIKNLPFELTTDQEKTIKEIEKDLTNNIRMNRLIQGDVGSGKTIIALIASYINYLSGYTTALMVPTEILATQHYQNSLDIFKKTNMKITLLTSKVKEKEKIYKQIEKGQIDLIIGTQSLIQEKVKYNNLGLIITDEQHRFGVHQREELKNKGRYTDVLSMSATPIPRTYALTIYGDMDVSSIKTKPEGRKEVITINKEEKDLIEVLTLIKKEIDLKHQIYVISPSIENNDNDNLDNINILKEKMNLAFGKIAKIGVIHGKLDNNEKEKEMKKFEENKIQILISTTVIEVGVNVPNASTIVIFQANFFGLSTLHQLRGRVGRGDIQSYCILISKKQEERLKMLETCTDGFKISEYDFQTRGEGDLFGVKQSGDADFKLANIKKDFELLIRVKEDIDNLTNN